MPPAPSPLPIDPFVPEISDHLNRRRAVVVMAPAGSGKTTRVPPALAGSGPVILLEPRRLAARSIARRIAEEQGWTLGEEVGWQVRFDRRFGPRTRLLVATEGILTARLQADPLLGEFRTVVLDEFHERSLHADLALALAREAWRARADLRLVVMSATLDAAAVARYLDDCPVVTVTGRQYQVEITYRPELDARAAIRESLEAGPGHVLCFLPGAPEIRRLAGELEAPGNLAPGVVVLPLHGSLQPAEQDRALAPMPGGLGRKVILATNVAETSLTVEGVAAVVDGGTHKLLRRDAATGVDRLVLERISRDAAEQRAGRAGRTGPGRALRLWDSRQELRPRREPEIARVDLAAPFLEVLAWGGDPLSFGWFEAPPREPAEAALSLLELLGAVAGGRLTPLGERLRRLPLHPRLGRLLLAAAGGRPEDGRAAAAACAILTEGWRPPREEHTTRSDLLSAADRIASAPAVVRQIARDLERERHFAGDAAPGGGSGDDAFLRAVLSAFPDRVARRRAPGSRRLLLQSGTGAELGRESGVETEFLVAVEITMAAAAGEPVVRVASAVEKEWLRADRHELLHWLDDAGVVRAVERGFYGALPLGERGLVPDPVQAQALLVQALLARPLGAGNQQLVRRLASAGISIDLPELLALACAGRTSLPAADFDLSKLLPGALARQLERAAPADLPLPSGRRARLEYREDGSVVAAVKLQELFGLAETPRVGAAAIEVTLELLAPNGRPVQTTRDLRSFWERTYPEVRKELRGRYPRHPWPEDPWTAPPSHRPKPRRKAV